MALTSFIAPSESSHPVFSPADVVAFETQNPALLGVAGSESVQHAHVHLSSWRGGVRIGNRPLLASWEQGSLSQRKDVRVSSGRLIWQRSFWCQESEAQLSDTYRNASDPVSGEGVGSPVPAGLCSPAEPSWGVTAVFAASLWRCPVGSL